MKNIADFVTNLYISSNKANAKCFTDILALYVHKTGQGVSKKLHSA